MTERTNKLANLEVAPDTQLVIWVDLSDWHPFVICAHSSKFPIREARARRREATPESRVVAVCRTGSLGLIRHFVIVLRFRLIMRLPLFHRNILTLRMMLDVTRMNACYEDPRQSTKMPDPFFENWLRFVRDIRPQFGGDLAGLNQAFGPPVAICLNRWIRRPGARFCPDSGGSGQFSPYFCCMALEISKVSHFSRE